MTTICQLTFPDHATVTAVVVQEVPEAEAEVKYSGAVERLPRKFAQSDGGSLSVLFQNLARETGAQFTFRTEGEFAEFAV